MRSRVVILSAMCTRCFMRGHSSYDMPDRIYSSSVRSKFLLVLVVTYYHLYSENVEVLSIIHYLLHFVIVKTLKFLVLHVNCYT